MPSLIPRFAPSWSSPLLLFGDDWRLLMSDLHLSASPAVGGVASPRCHAPIWSEQTPRATSPARPKGAED